MATKHNLSVEKHSLYYFLQLCHYDSTTAIITKFTVKWIKQF